MIKLILIDDYTNGPPFNAEKFSNFCAKRNIKLIRTAPYNPRLNGLAEREDQTFKKLLTKSIIANKKIVIKIISNN